MVLWVGLQFVIVAFPDHTHFLLYISGSQVIFVLFFTEIAHSVAPDTMTHNATFHWVVSYCQILDLGVTGIHWNR